MPILDEREEISRIQLLHGRGKIVLTLKRLYSPSSEITLSNPPHYLGHAWTVDLDSLKQREKIDQSTGRKIEFTSVNWFDYMGKDMGWMPIDVFFL